MLVDVPIEEFTAREATNLGLVESLKSGKIKIEGSYKITSEGKIKFNQKNFLFIDKYGSTRCGRFTDDIEVLKFLDFFRFS